jgi:hypothetical protein
MSNVEEELFLMTNLYPASTGLPMVIWVRPELWRSSTTCRIKVSMAHGTRTDPRNLATVGVRPTPHLVAGQLPTADLQVVTEWIRLRKEHTAAEQTTTATTTRRKNARLLPMGNPEVLPRALPASRCNRVFGGARRPSRPVVSTDSWGTHR